MRNLFLSAIAGALLLSAGVPVNPAPLHLKAKTRPLR